MTASHLPYLTQLACGRYTAAYITHVGRGQTGDFSDKVVEAPFMAGSLYEADL
jgi:hypothetical protein